MIVVLWDWWKGGEGGEGEGEEVGEEVGEWLGKVEYRGGGTIRERGAKGVRTRCRRLWK